MSDMRSSERRILAHKEFHQFHAVRGITLEERQHVTALQNHQLAIGAKCRSANA